MVTYVPLFIASRSAERPRGCLEKVLFESPKTNLATTVLIGHLPAKNRKKEATNTTNLPSGDVIMLSSKQHYSANNLTGELGLVFTRSPVMSRENNSMDV